MTASPIVLIDRHTVRCAEVCASLAADGWTVVPAASESMVANLLARLQPRLLIVGVLPPCEASALCAEVQRWASVPILLLLDAQPSTQIAALLECGADDYLRTPFTPAELQTRVQSLLRRVAGNARAFQVGDGELTLDPQTQTVQVRGSWVELTLTEYRLLWRLARRAGTVLTCAELLAGGDPLYATDPTYLAMYIWHLRQKLERDPRQPRLLLTKEGVGYQLVP